MNIIEKIGSYIPKNEQEEKDKELMLQFLHNEKNCFSRDNLSGHFTVSAWIVNSQHTKTLFCYHNIYNSWSWVGGHADGNEDLLSVAVKEAKEETGITPVRIFSDIFSIEILPVSGHIRKGEYVSSHIHYNVTFLIEADENEKISSNPEENSAVKWFFTEEIPEISSEPWMVKFIYKKLIETT